MSLSALRAAVLSIFSPAKLNLFLAVTGRRPDGFHDLVSLVTTVQFGDTLHVEPTTGVDDVLECADPAVPRDDSNLVLKAARAFRAATGGSHGVRFVLEKRIPMGAGLGGGSSNGVAALQALNELAGRPLGQDQLSGIAAQLGSDCPLFLAGAPLVMRGRGERVELLSPAAAKRLAGTRVLVFKPAFGVETAWAYRRMAEQQARHGNVYIPSPEAERRLAAWIEHPDQPVEELLFNNLERPAFEKQVALPTLLERLRAEGLRPRMTGSGSACFAVLPEGVASGRIRELILDAWGETTFVIETRLA